MWIRAIRRRRLRGDQRLAVSSRPPPSNEGFRRTSVWRWSPGALHRTEAMICSPALRRSPMVSLAAVCALALAPGSTPGRRRADAASAADHPFIDRQRPRRTRPDRELPGDEYHERELHSGRQPGRLPGRHRDAERDRRATDVHGHRRRIGRPDPAKPVVDHLRARYRDHHLVTDQLGRDQRDRHVHDCERHQRHLRSGQNSGTVRWRHAHAERPALWSAHGHGTAIGPLRGAVG